MKKLIGILSVIVLLSFAAVPGWKTYNGKWEFVHGLMVDTLRSIGTPPVTRGNTALPIVDTNGKFSFIPNSTNGYVMTMVSGVPAWAANSGGGGSTYTFRNSLATGDTILYFPNSTTVVGKTISIANGTNTTVSKSITDSSIVYTVNSSAGSYTFNNGITNTSGTVGLGGTITSDVNFPVGSQHNVSWGTTNNYLGSFTINAVGTTNLQSGIQLGIFGANNVSVSLPGANLYPLVTLPDLTSAGADATVSMASSNQGQLYILYNTNTSSTNHWVFGGTAAVKDLAGNTITTLTNGKAYMIIYDGSNWRQMQF